MKRHRRAGIDEIEWIDDFVSERARTSILSELEYCFWWPSLVVSRDADGGWRSGRSDWRASETTTERWFTLQLMTEVRRIERRVERILGEPPDCFEGWQATRYGPGQYFDDHYDFGHCRDEPAGERRATLVLYLRCPAGGGGTHFPERDLTVAARPGRLLFFRNLLPDGSEDMAMLHASLPVRRGRKLTLVNWIRERPVRGARANSIRATEERRP
ncbi:MAG: 2OG-Fe(II) oxygenase [Proteobacteria bacterium]|nr:2OG-Fe(II) oxygenase [Pseudomonadota bacterium]